MNKETRTRVYPISTSELRARRTWEGAPFGKYPNKTTEIAGRYLV